MPASNTPLGLPPHSIEAEQAVLGGLVRNASQWPDVADVIRADDFYRADHRLLFAAIQTLADGPGECDLVTVVEGLRSAGDLERVSSAYVSELSLEAAGVNLRSYAQIIRDNAMLRGVIKAADAMTQSAFTRDGASAAEKIDAAESALGAVRDGRDSGSVVSAKEAVRRTIADIERAHDAGDTITGVASGLADLDRMTGGFQPGDLVFLAARPSMGKTSLAMQMAYKAALRGEHVGVFSLEMSVEQLIKRAQSNLSGVGLERVQRPALLENDDWTRLTNASAELAHAPIAFVDMPGMSVMDIRAKARQMHRKDPLKLVVIDYLQMIPGESKSDNRNSEIEKISRALKQMARELNCPVLCLSQLNRGVESRTDKRPMLSDLRDSGSVEQDADIVLFIYQDEKYNDDSPHAGVAELLLRKQRNGPTGHIDTAWHGPTVAFRDYSGPNRSEREGSQPRRGSRDYGLDYEV